MSEPEPNGKQPGETSDGAADDGSQGDFTLQELMQAHSRNFDHLGRRIDCPDENE